MHTAAISLCSSFPINRRTLLKFPYPVSPSSMIGIEVASDMNSSTSNICVQLASLLSRTPYCAEIANPPAHRPLNPDSSAIFALIPLCDSSKNSRISLLSKDLN